MLLFSFVVVVKMETAYEMRISDGSSDCGSSDLLRSGFDAPYVPGWDCHGLPIEHAVEKKFGKVGDKLDAAAFRQKCREYATEQIELPIGRASCRERERQYV